jgi:molybdopterin-containing oxidoreductase family iron-sulfur binding subunit
MNETRPPLSVGGAPSNGKVYWRSLEELADSPAFREWVTERFPRSMRELLESGVDRRRFLQLMAAPMALVGLSGCRRPVTNAMPYTRSPEDVVPGLPTYYATAMPRPGTASPILVESHEGRPTKVEGNPKHPASSGTATLDSQASVLDLYDPDRFSPVLRAGETSTWEAYDTFATRHFAEFRANKGKGLHVLGEDVASPSLELLREHVRKVLPEARWHTYEPISSFSLRAGALAAFGTPVVPLAQFDRASVIVSLDCDFLGLEEDGGRHLLDFAESRRPIGREGAMNRLYVVESRFSLTGGMADHRLRLASSHVVAYTIALARATLASSSADRSLQSALESSPLSREVDWKLITDSMSAIDRNGSGTSSPMIPWIDEVAAELKAHTGRSIVIAGRRQPAVVHALAHAINAALQNLGQTVELRAAPPGSDTGSLKELAATIENGAVETLVILGGNPAYNAPADMDFANLQSRVKTVIRLGLYADETSQQATWHLPAAHFLEYWGDARTSDGTVVPIQPLIEPLHNGRSALAVVGQMSGFESIVPYEIVRRAFRKLVGSTAPDFEGRWRRFLHDGLLDGSAYPRANPAIQWKSIASAVAAAQPAQSPLSLDNLELVFDRDAKVDDGRFANNGWLQEVPDPVTKLTWDNAAIVSPRTARLLGVASGDLVRLEIDGRSLEIAAIVMPGQADFSVFLSLGYGREVTGRVARGVGFNAYRLRGSKAPDIALGLRATRLHRSYPLAGTQNHFRLEGRDLVRELTLADLLAPHPHDQREHDMPELIAHPVLDGQQQWGMVIDLNTCTGCSACVVACQSENNIPIVGKDEIRRGREMHWIRLDRYFSGSDEEPELVHQPVACVQCENAPCEVVCPVNATVHSDDGLNVQVYSRCIGTRYCANNCPYKVRRFNYFNYNERPLDELRRGPLTEKGMAETLKMQKNPDVTVRIRGVMEKCTYCVQRIERGKIGAKIAAGATGLTLVPDGTIVPACAQACPARAIVFGDLTDPESRVSKLRAQPRNYSLLGELNTGPRTTYLARVRNPNPKMPLSKETRS